MNNEATPTIDENGYWQLIELIASPDCDIDTDIIAEALDKITNGSVDERKEGIQMIRREAEKYLPTGLA